MGGKYQDYDIGFGKPPGSTRWKKGCVSPNPLGRPRRGERSPTVIVTDRLAEEIEYKQNDRLKRTSRLEYLLRVRAAKALKGDIRKIEWFLKVQLEGDVDEPVAYALILSEDDLNA